MNKLTIMIPTYNRAGFLYKNIKQLCGMIQENGLIERVYIIVSDNASQDNTSQVIKKIKEEEKDVYIKYIRRKENVGISENLMGILEKTETEFAMVFPESIIHFG